MLNHLESPIQTLPIIIIIITTCVRTIIKQQIIQMLVKYSTSAVHRNNPFTFLSELQCKLRSARAQRTHARVPASTLAHRNKQNEVMRKRVICGSKTYYNLLRLSNMPYPPFQRIWLQWFINDSDKHHMKTSHSLMIVTNITWKHHIH